MALYRCCFLDRSGRIRVAEDIDVEGLSDAIDRALTMLKHRPQHHSVEVWQGELKVYPIDPLRAIAR